ncbi:hypothetical protein [Priestia megaterium]|uniref:hypothetical protein n=1 Tax=Priestia megaterium TaxID=1404 RepID=UPI0013637F7F|nr:hypothetical protein [Priestia megaterium]
MITIQISEMIMKMSIGEFIFLGFSLMFAFMLLISAVNDTISEWKEKRGCN